MHHRRLRGSGSRLRGSVPHRGRECECGDRAASAPLAGASGWLPARQPAGISVLHRFHSSRAAILTTRRVGCRERSRLAEEGSRGAGEGAAVGFKPTEGGGETAWSRGKVIYEARSVVSRAQTVGCRMHRVVYSAQTAPYTGRRAASACQPVIYSAHPVGDAGHRVIYLGQTVGYTGHQVIYTGQTAGCRRHRVVYTGHQVVLRPVGGAFKRLCAVGACVASLREYAVRISRTSPSLPRRWRGR